MIRQGPSREDRDFKENHAALGPASGEQDWAGQLWHGRTWKHLRRGILLYWDSALLATHHLKEDTTFWAAQAW